jgi:hypothetical protein
MAWSSAVGQLLEDRGPNHVEPGSVLYKYSPARVVEVENCRSRSARALSEPADHDCVC